jgi:hypothetical protein
MLGNFDVVAVHHFDEVGRSLVSVLPFDAVNGETERSEGNAEPSGGLQLALVRSVWDVCAQNGDENRCGNPKRCKRKGEPAGTLESPLEFPPYELLDVLVVSVSHCDGRSLALDA